MPDNHIRGVVLAGGLGTRLYPLTKVTNKHLLPVYDRPMITYPIECLVKAGITDILVVTGGNNPGDFLKLLGNGKDLWGLSYQLRISGGRRRDSGRVGLGRSSRSGGPNLRRAWRQHHRKEYQGRGGRLSEAGARSQNSPEESERPRAIRCGCVGR